MSWWLALIPVTILLLVVGFFLFVAVTQVFLEDDLEDRW